MKEARMPRNVDTALLRAFVAVAETSGMTAAAHVLNLTQAAVSQQIKRLEETFGCPLFERQRKGLQLTSAGERLFGRAKRLLALNDEIWAEMTTPLYEGEVRLGIPNDLVNTYLPTFLKSFAKAYPKVRISLECSTSPRLMKKLQAGEVDLTLTTELGCGADGEGLVAEQLVWVGARGGDAYLQRPLPISIGCDGCAFQAPVLDALREADIPWRMVSDVTNMDAQVATAQADLAVMTSLASTVPGHLEVLSPRSGLPSLPAFSINLYLPKAGGSDIAREFARHIRESLRERQRLAA
jgi:DNA-binding transcriptional LysR family regulator